MIIKLNKSTNITLYPILLDFRTRKYFRRLSENFLIFIFIISISELPRFNIQTLNQKKITSIPDYTRLSDSIKLPRISSENFLTIFFVIRISELVRKRKKKVKKKLKKFKFFGTLTNLWPSGKSVSSVRKLQKPFSLK